MSFESIIESKYFIWLMGPIAFISWVIILIAIKNNMIKRIRNLADRTKTEVDDILIKSLKIPVNLIIIFSGILLMEKIMPLPEAIDKYAIYIMKLLLIFASILFVDQFVRGLLAMKSIKSEFIGGSQGIIQGIVRGFILILGALITLDTLGVTITPLLASLGVGSLAVALALKDTLANLFGGIFLIIDKPVKSGQYIELENGQRGYIEDIGLRSTKVRTRRDITIIIPNNKIINSILSNYHQPEKDFSHRIQIGVSYKNDLDHVEKVTMEVAKEVQENVNGAIKGYEPYMRFHTFGDDGIIFYVNLRVLGYDKRRRVMHEFIKRLHKRYAIEGIEIPYPQRVIGFDEKSKKFLQENLG